MFSYFKKHLVFFFLFFVGASTILAQPNSGRPNRGGMADSKGRAYGKIFDAISGKPLEFVVVRVYKEDSLAVKTNNLNPITGGLTDGKGEFLLPDLPINTPLTLRFSFSNSDAPYSTFVLKPSMQGGMGAIEKDLGNFKLKFGNELSTIQVEGGGMRLEFDKRIYEVDKNPMNSGGTGEDVLRNIPSLTVDADGNVSLRNTAPQIFVDGRPTTLTIDQIPADAIQRVELITNPSAKYDASGGGGGIVNIVMKHNRSNGYNGSARSGIDKRGRINAGLDMNYRQGK
ncbi:MAG: TonB-dependent receptor plug domain-containing protein, partial [Bacteroidota bacterium]